jgi:Flp pilus assembly protein TadD
MPGGYCPVMKTKESIRSTVTMEPAGDLLLDGIRELSRGDERAALETFMGVLDGDATLGALCSARLHILRREPEQAARTLAELIAREPGLAEAHYMLATVHRDGYRTFDAIRCFREALRLDPTHSRAAEGLSDLLDVQEP